MKAVSTIVILNHVAREKEGLALQKLIQTQTAQPGIEVKISFDDGSMGLWENYKQALRIKPKEPERWRFILHDDIAFPRQILTKILHILKYASDDFISVYNPRNQAYRKVYESGSRVMKTDQNFWMQGCLYPTSIIEHSIKWADERFIPEYRSEDGRIVHYLKAHGMFMYCIIPGFIQHVGAFRSVIGNPGKVIKLTRNSGQFHPEQDVYNVNWLDEFRKAPQVNGAFPPIEDLNAKGKRQITAKFRKWKEDLGHYEKESDSN